MDTFAIFNISAYVTSSLSLILNILLIFLITKSSTKEIKSYRHVLLQTCAVDIVFAFISGFTVTQIETNGVRYYFRTPWYPQFGIYPCIAIWMYISALLALLWSMIIQALFRYYIIVKRETPTSQKTWICQFSIFVVALVISWNYLCIPCQNTSAIDNEALKEMALWKTNPDLINSFRSFLLQDIWTILFVSLVFILTFTAHSLFFITNWKVAQTLSSSKIHFSPQTLKIHKQFGHRIILQSIMPFLSLIVVGTIFLFIYVIPSSLIPNQGGLLLIALMFLQYIVVFNPLITMFSIKSYRRALLCQTPKKDGISTMLNRKLTAVISSAAL